MAFRAVCPVRNLIPGRHVAAMARHTERMATLGEGGRGAREGPVWRLVDPNMAQRTLDTRLDVLVMWEPDLVGHLPMSAVWQPRQSSAATPAMGLVIRVWHWLTVLDTPDLHHPMLVPPLVAHGTAQACVDNMLAVRKLTAKLLAREVFDAKVALQTVGGIGRLQPGGCRTLPVAGRFEHAQADAIGAVEQIERVAGLCTPFACSTNAILSSASFSSLRWAASPLASARFLLSCNAPFTASSRFVKLACHPW